MLARSLSPTPFAAAVFALCACVPAPPEYEPPPLEETAGKQGIVGGSSASILQHPWQVSLQSSFGSPFCGGSVIQREWVLTANHCVEGSSASSLRVVAGVTRLSQSNGGQVRAVEQIVRYPGYFAPEYGKDVALLKVSPAFDLSDPGVAAIDLVTPAEASAGLTAPGVEATVSGWGALSSGGGSPDVLQAVNVPIVSQNAAQAAYSGTNITADQLGAGLIGVGGRDSCQGDSGGPLTVPDGAGGRRLAGVVSWGYGCASSRWPGMYARVSAFASWIQSYVDVNEAPSVQITQPADGAIVQGTLVVSAAASDPDGRVTRVRFTFPDGATIDDTNAPFAVTWDSTGFPDGPAPIRAQAFDDGGASSPADQITVNLSNGNSACATGAYAAQDTPIAIPDASSAGVSSSLLVGGSGTISDLQVSLRITHTYRSDLVVQLVAPSGSAAVLSNRAGGSADDLVFSAVDVSIFDGEPAAGVWQLVVQDLARQDVGRLESWSLDLDATCAGGGGGGGPWSAERTPNLSTVDDGVVCDSVTVSGPGDAADVKLDIEGRHDWRAALRATLEHDGVTVEAFGAGTFPRQGGAFGFSGRAISGFVGDAAGTWTLCLFDTDAYGDTGVLGRWRVGE